ncbi:MAG: hypothetical protein JXX29_07180 [Deltaproteobacteria bacterium]|nr:hypothetical protein [Deltaproteobacteria bacterium]MBN2671437.1 hypothetical protein [Deltaproteobacteria bacterium]
MRWYWVVLLAVLTVSVSVRAEIAIPEAVETSDTEQSPAADTGSDTATAAANPAPDMESAAEDIQEVEEVEEVETVDDVQTVDTASATAAHSADDAGANILGRLHPAFVHLPLGLLVALLIFEWRTLGRVSGPATVWLWAAAAASFVPAAMSGFLRAQEMISLGGQPDVASHRSWMFVAFGMLVAAAVVRWRTSSESRKFRWAALLVLGLAVAAAFFGAHLGGKLVYGPDFLPF